ncbi:hypothetical protein A2U01_0036310 [Trifolium medium]|uniref:Uncharacterized protein n=1 Tax=Trifolium medium TaxID=97028 RepID=A0A392PTL7_9FABA|nr:hypothetical protein [Trifolium medium]
MAKSHSTTGYSVNLNQDRAITGEKTRPLIEQSPSIMLKPCWGEDNNSWGGTSKIQYFNITDPTKTNVSSALRPSWGHWGTIKFNIQLRNVDHVPNTL